MTGKIRILFPNGKELKHKLTIGTVEEVGEPNYTGNGEFYLRLHELAGLKKWRPGDPVHEILKNIGNKGNES